jgi:hypothetical protein
MGYEQVPGMTGSISAGGEYDNLDTTNSNVYPKLAAEDAAAAALSAAQALASKNAAAASATVALNAETVVAASAASAFTSATNASASATAASAALSAVTEQAVIATTQAINAANSATAASTSEDNAGTSETNAAASASTATTQAGVATTQAGVATTQATNATTSATSASSSAASALDYKNAAALSASGARTSELSALDAASAAASSATDANAAANTATTQATNASSSASTATTQAGIATTQATNAAASASNASTSASTATTKASEAATSASNAAASASSASSSASTATTKASEASTSATDAASSASSASTSASTATTQATNAASSASSASASASTATTKASEADVSATAAASSASGAATSAVSAASSAASAAALLDNFDDRYLGAKASAPSVDNDGNALIVGALYFDTTEGKMFVYTASGWLAASSASVATLATFEFVATAGQTVFSGNDVNGVSLSYTTSALMISLNGVALRPGDDFTATNGTSITLTSAASLNDELVVYAFGSFVIADTYSVTAADAQFLPKVNPSYTGTLTGGTGVVNLGSGQFYKDASGNVGIGTASPNGRLQITGGTTNASSLATAYSAAAFTLVPKSSSGFSLAFGSGPSDFPYIQMSAAGSVASDMALQPYGGNLGIGTGSPQQRLDVTGGYLQLRDSTGSGGYRLTIGADSTSCRLNSVDNTPLTFSMGGSEKARIDSSGNLLVGKSTTDGATVGTYIGTGGANFVSSIASTNDGPQIQIANVNASVVNGYRFISFRANVGATQVGTITTNGTSTTAYNTSSDYRLKEDIQPMTRALEKVAALKPVTYTWKADGSNGQGFIAHELQEVISECVTGEKDAVETYTDAEGNEQTRPVYQGIDTSFLVATLTAAIQEQQVLINKQQAALTTLTARIEALEN